MISKSNIDSADGTKLLLDIPSEDANLFRSHAVHELLSLLSRYHDNEFSVTELVEAVDYSQPTVSKSIDILRANNLVVDRRDGASRLIQINRDRLYHPDEPYLQIPQSEFHEPVRAAVAELRAQLDNVIGIVLYGSVARGEADRRSDIDLWVLVKEERMANQRGANRVRQALEDRTFDTGRYAYEIDVESLPAVPDYSENIREILSDGLAVYETEQFSTVQSMIFHGDLDE